MIECAVATARKWPVYLLYDFWLPLIERIIEFALIKSLPKILRFHYSLFSNVSVKDIKHENSV